MVRYIIIVLIVILVIAVIILIKNSMSVYRANPCRHCKHVGEKDGQLVCWSPFFEENKVEKLPVFKPCKEVRGSSYCNFQAR